MKTHCKTPSEATALRPRLIAHALQRRVARGRDGLEPPPELPGAQLAVSAQAEAETSRHRRRGRLRRPAPNELAALALARQLVAQLGAQLLHGHELRGLVPASRVAQKVEKAPALGTGRILRASERLN